MKKKTSYNHLAWVSILRIFATIQIFYFHFLGLFKLKNHGIDTIAIALFCLISGYLVYPIKEPTSQWVVKKYLQIIIPYWLVIICVIIINYIVRYKPKQLHELLVIFFSGGMFVRNPLYVISWYITFILCLYFMVALCNVPRNNFLKLFMIALSINFYYFVINRPFIYLISFAFGYLLKFYCQKFDLSKILIPTTTNSKLDHILFFLQNRCYSFFLIHGGVLLFFTKVYQLPKESCLISSFLLSGVLAHMHYIFSTKIFSYLRPIITFKSKDFITHK